MCATRAARHQPSPGNISASPGSPIKRRRSARPHLRDIRPQPRIESRHDADGREKEKSSSTPVLVKRAWRSGGRGSGRGGGGKIVRNRRMVATCTWERSSRLAGYSAHLAIGRRRRLPPALISSARAPKRKGLDMRTTPDPPPPATSGSPPLSPQGTHDSGRPKRAIRAAKSGLEQTSVAPGSGGADQDKGPG